MSKKAIFLQRLKRSLFISKENLIGTKGQLTLYALLLSMMLICYTLFIILKCAQTHQELKGRLQAYQCFHALDVNQAQYIKYMSRLNMAVWTSHKLSMFPQAKTLHQSLILAQDALHFSYLKKTLKNESCRLDQSAAYATKLPYRTRLIIFLEHKIDGTVTVNNKEWQTWLLALKTKEPFFLLKGTYKLEGDFTSSSKLKVTEETVSSKASFGSHS